MYIIIDRDEPLSTNFYNDSEIKHARTRARVCAVLVQNTMTAPGCQTTI